MYYILQCIIYTIYIYIYIHIYIYIYIYKYEGINKHSEKYNKVKIINVFLVIYIL